MDTEDRGVSKIDTPSGTQQMTIISESGLHKDLSPIRRKGVNQSPTLLTCRALRNTELSSEIKTNVAPAF